MITPSFGLTATERVLPRLALDFTTATVDSRVTFTRSGATATRVNSSGFVETVAADTARFDFSPVTLDCKGLLIEEARTNLATYSEDLITGWSPTNLVRTTESDTTPSNAATVTKIAASTTNAAHQQQQTVTVTNGTTYTLSFYVKAAGISRIYVLMAQSTSPFTTQAQAFINLATGQVTSGTAIVQDAGNGWYRVSVTGTATSSGSLFRIQLTSPSATFNFAGNDVDGVYIWGAQAEAGAFLTSYIPNLATGSTTRNADVATMTGTNFSDWYSAGAGGALGRAVPSTVSGTRPLMQLDDGTADNIIALRGNTTNPELYIKAGGADQAQIDAGTIAANTAYRLAGAWAADACAASINSGAPVLDSAATIPAVTQARLGSDGTNYLNGHLQSIEYYGEQVTPAELQVLSSQAGSRSMIRSLINPVL